MATILRVKRRNADEPLDVLIIACKRQKTSDDNSKEATGAKDLAAVVKFAGTIQNQDDVAEQIVKTIKKDHLKDTYRQHSVDITAKNRLQVQENSRDNRYKVINCFRSLDPNIKELDEKGMTVIDVEDSVSCYSKQLGNDKESDYVYDLYYTKTEQEILAPDNFSICMPNEELVFDSYRESPDHPDNCQSEDSNSESNWRNDYPDSEQSDNSIDDEDIILAVQRVKIDAEESDLSDDDNDFVYTVDEADVDNYGYKYAKFKAKIVKENEDSHSATSDCSEVYISEVASDDNDDGDDDEKKKVSHSNDNDDIYYFCEDDD